MTTVFSENDMIKISDVTVSYDDNIVLHNINYEFHRNQCYVVQGESGAGKTTLLNLIAGYIEPDLGAVTRSADVKADYMFQDLLSFTNATVLENLALKYYAGRTKEPWDLEYVKSKCKDILSRFKIDYLLNRKMASLSGGEKQRVLLAGMLVSDADVLLLDEPLASLDAENRQIMVDLIGLCVPSRVIIIVSHISLGCNYPVRELEVKDGCLYEK